MEKWTSVHPQQSKLITPILLYIDVLPPFPFLYREALSYGDLTAQALAKVSRGLSDLPYPFKQVGKAKELALKAVEMNPTNPMTLHTLAMFYERHELVTFFFHYYFFNSVLPLFFFFFFQKV